MPQTPGIGFPPDSATSLWRKVSENFFEIAQAYGYSGYMEPSNLDGEINATRKCVTWTAFIGENLP